MIGAIIKKILSFCDVTVNFTEGDQLHIKIVFGNKTVFDRTIDVIKGA